MKSQHRRWLVVIAMVAIVASSLGGVAVAQPSENATDAGEQYTIDELRQDGKHYSVDGARIVPSEERVYWLEHTPANQPWRKVSKENNGPKFGSGQTLKTDTLYLRTIRAQTETQSVTVKVASWNRGTQTVKRGNTTTEKEVAKNVSVMTQQVQLGPGWSLGEVNLPRHDESKQVTMWIVGNEDTARWRFQHRSVATSRPIDITTWGGFLVKVFQYVGLPVLVGGLFAGKKVRSAVESAGIGPQWGFGRWLATISLLTAVVVFGTYTQLAQAIVIVPYLLGAWLVMVMAAYMLSTHRGEIKTKSLLKPDVSDAVSFTNARATDDDAGAATDGGTQDVARDRQYAYDILQGDYATITTLEDENGMAVVRGGLIPFLARVYGARAMIENIKEVTARVQFPTSTPDEMFFVDPEADSLIEYEPPGFELSIPEYTRQEWATRGVFAAAGLGAAWKLAGLYGSLVWPVAIGIAAIAVAKFYIEPTDGYARIEPAPVHFRQAFASTLMMSHGIRDAKDLAEAKKRWRLEKLKNRKESQEELDEFDRDMMDFFAGESVSDEYEEISTSGEPMGPPTPGRDVATDGGDDDDDT